MSRHEYRSYSLGMIVLLILSTTIPAFAEVTNLQTNSESFFKDEEIKFSGTVEEGSNGLVTIVIRDLNDEFVMLTQAMISPDDSFEKTIKIEGKFSKHGMYNATGFILNMTSGVTTDFGVSLNSVPIILDEEKIEDSKELISQNSIEKEPIQETVPTPRLIDFVDSSKDPQYYIDRYYNEESYKSWFDRNYPGLTIEEAVGYDNIQTQSATTEPAPQEEISEEPIQETVPTPRLIDFVDSSKDPQYYIDRYYNEESYKSWFDRNYPGLTIEEAVGHTNNVNEIKSAVQKLIDKEIIPEVEASSLVEPTQEQNNNSEIAQISLAVAGLGILFGAVYGVKRKVDDNSKQISINRDTIRKRLIRPIIGSSPREILRTRLAKGEITLEEYEKLKTKLN